ncbi:MAG: hypothetical protein ACPGN3_07115 [Opitutales bacterium]
MAFQSPKNNIGFQVTVILGVFSLICLATAAVFNMDSGKAISMTVPGKGEFSESFKSEKKNQVYFVQLRGSTGNLPWNSGWSEAEVEIADANNTPLFAFGGDFWREAGRDDDGPWQEHKSLNKMKITLRDPGTYNLNVDFNSSVANPGKLTVTLHPKRASSLPFFVLGIISFIAAVAIGYFSSKTIVHQAVRNFDYEF